MKVGSPRHIRAIMELTDATQKKLRGKKEMISCRGTMRLLAWRQRPDSRNILSAQ